MKKPVLVSLGALAVTCAISLSVGSKDMTFAAPPMVPPGTPPAVAVPTPTKQVEIDLDKALAVPMPKADKELTPKPFQTKDLKKGWVIEIPGNRPIATPAYADGKLFVGGGYGSYEFYAFDAETGKLVWKIHTGDDGPTAAVVENGLVAFNTESCTVMVVRATDGKVVWQEWLGDPLMSQPAVANGKLYIGYPGGQRGHSGTPGYRMLCADMKTGKHLWDSPIGGEVQSAPVIDGGKVYFTCFDGTAFCLDADSGKEVWKKASSGTSAPVIAGGKVILTSKHKEGSDIAEGVVAMLPPPPLLGASTMSTAQQAAFQKAAPAEMSRSLRANYLKKAGGMLTELQSTQLDSAVGFGGGYSGAGAYGDEGLNVSSVAGGWAYQGSRVAVNGDKMMNAQGNTIRVTDMRSAGRITWQADAKGKSVTQGQQLFSPPALGKKNMYLCSAQGHLISVAQSDGAINFMYSTNQPMAFQPILVNGNMYAGTSNGRLMCLSTGDADADGWTAWGGNSSHNLTEHKDK